MVSDRCVVWVFYLAMQGGRPPKPLPRSRVQCIEESLIGRHMAVGVVNRLRDMSVYAEWLLSWSMSQSIF